MISRILLLARTIRHLRVRQLWYRPVRRLQAWLPLPPLAAAQLGGERVTTMRRAIVEWGPGNINERIARADGVCDGRFTFLNVSLDLSRVPWRGAPVSPLWSFNLHYFDYALDLAWAYEGTRDPRYLKRFEELVTDWDRETRGGGGDAWNPYAVSIRTMNWIYALALFGDSLTPDFRRQLTESLHRQVVFLSSRVEWNILANHLLKNLQAIALASLAFDGEKARSWRETWTEQLWRELDEQFLPDGGHFERSPMYQAIAAGDLLELLVLRNRCGLANPPAVVQRARRMVVALNYMARPNGSLRLFNDSANGIAPALSYLNRLAEPVFAPDLAGVNRERWELPHTGYFGGRAGKFELMLDCGEISASYQPGHAHCDILSYELDYDDLPFVVDSGVSGYDGDPFRDYSRATRAHNTVMIDGKEQSELWGTFRVARRAELIEARREAGDSSDTFSFRGGYRPYGRRDVSHFRGFRLTPSSLQIVDTIRGAPEKGILSFVHFHPDCRVEQTGRGFRISRQRRTLVLVPTGFDSTRIIRGARQPDQGWFLPEFGKSMPSFVLELGLARNDGRDLGYIISAE